MIIRLDALPWHQRIKMLRTLKGWSQEKAAEKCNTNQKAYWDWENGKRYPRKSNRTAIAKAFGVIEEDIFGDKISQRAI